MQFVKNGPDVPEKLLQAHEDGRVVFFCGAGVSYPAGLPGYRNLVERIYADIGEVRNALEETAFKAGQYDTTLSLLEGRILSGRSVVRRALSRILTPSSVPPAATRTHESLLRLARNQLGQTRLITTNFDRLFEEAMRRLGTDLPTFAAPLLPVPKKRWDGLVYLHGRLPETPKQAELDRLVASSGDFGLAYLTERWAARFVSELFRNHTVCFVGYSINDPVMRYMMDAIAADRLLGEAPIEVFAFGNHARGREKDATVEWVAKNVTPILYTNHNRHTHLHDTLAGWAATYRDGVRGKEAIVTRYALLRPTGSTRQDNFVGRMRWALTDTSGLPAKALASHDPLPSLDWLAAFAENAFGHHDLDRFGVRSSETVDKDLRYSLVARPAPYTLAPWMRVVQQHGDISSRWDAVMAHIAHWLTRHLDDPKLLTWIASQGGALHHQFRFLIARALADRPPSPGMAALWRVALSGLLIGAAEPGDLYDWLARFKKAGLTPLLRKDLRKLLEPRVSLRPLFRYESDELPVTDGDGTEGKRPNELVDWELELASRYVHSGLSQFKTTYQWNIALPDLLRDLTDLLVEAMGIMRELQAASDHSDRSHWDQPSIREHPQNRKFRDWTALIELVRDSWIARARQNPSAAINEMQFWWDQPYPIFKRLAFFALAERLDLVTPSAAIDYLLADDKWWLWSIETQREATRLMASLAPVLSSSDARRLQAALLEGLPRSMFSQDLPPNKLDRLVDREVWNRLTAYSAAGGTLTEFAVSRLASISERYPEWEPATKRDEFPVWMGDDGSWRQRLITPTTDSEMIEWLKLNPGEDDLHFEDDWRDVCRRNFDQTSSALLTLAGQGHWIAGRWRAALQAWSEKELVDASWKRLATPLSEAPDSFLTRIDHALAWWLKAMAKDVGELRGQFFSLVHRVLSLRRAETLEETDDPWMSAINHPVGMVTEAVLDFWYTTGLEDDQGLPDEIRAMFSDLCDMEVQIFQHARLLLCAAVITLFRVDKSWTMQLLLPQFEWHEPGTSARLAWTGYLWSPRLYRPLLEAIRTAFLETATHYGDLSKVAEQYASLLTFVALEEATLFAKADLRAATANLSKEGLKRAVHTVADGLQGAGDRRAEYWRNRAKPYFASVWPKSNNLLDLGIANEMRRVVIGSGTAFPDAVATLADWLIRSDDFSYSLTLLGEAGHCANYPEEALTFLDRTVAGNSSWTVHELEPCLGAIQVAWPEANLDSRFQRLETIVRKGK